MATNTDRRALDAADVWAVSIPRSLTRVLDDLAAGLPDGSRYSASPSATAKAAWRVVVKHLPTATEEQARGVIRTWLKTGLLDQERNTTTRWTGI